MHSVPLKKLTVENLRMLVLQQIGLSHLVPIALDFIEKNPLVGGDFYSGDLLMSVASAPEEFCAAHQEPNNRLAEVKSEMHQSALPVPLVVSLPRRFAVMILRKPNENRATIN